VSAELTYAFEQLLFREARLLDELAYESWLELLSDRLRYWAPVRSNVDVETFDRPGRLALFDDRKADLSMRVRRLRTGHAHAEKPPSRVRRLITNVVVLGRQGEGPVQVASSFLVTVSRWEHAAKVYSGAREDLWVPHGDGWLLETRRILFDLSTTDNMSFLV
jgi:3-phenylpropionate/cinnamic acid dioxygenase small subunit